MQCGQKIDCDFSTTIIVQCTMHIKPLTPLIFCYLLYYNVVMYVVGSLLYGPLKILQQYTVVPCKHKRPVLPINCLRKMAIATKKGKEKYFIATQVSVDCYCLCLQVVSQL